ncbi:GNAT family N-acetyltransferase [Rhizobium anhuiense]
MNELDKAGMSFQPYMPPAWNDPCLICVDDSGNAKGFLVYRYDEPRCSWFILLAYVVPSSRRHGVHTELFAALVERGKKRGDILSIDSGTHVKNVPAQKAFAAQGRRATAIHYEYRLLEWLPGASHLNVPAVDKVSSETPPICKTISAAEDQL